MSVPVARDASGEGLFGWWKDGTPAARRALLAAALGWMLDAFDVMLYALVLTSIMADLEIGRDTAGALGSATLLASAGGGMLFGVDRGSLRPHPRADGQRARLLDLHRRLWLRAERLAARGLPRAPGHRHGRRVGERRRAGIGNLAGAASWQGAGIDAKRVGDRVRARGLGHHDRAAAVGLARGVLRRHPAGLLHALGAAQRRRAGDLAHAPGEAGGSAHAVRDHLRAGRCGASPSPSH